MVPDRLYTPPEASLSDYTHLLNTLGFQRGVIVQPSVYGTDNRVTLDLDGKGVYDNRTGVGFFDHMLDQLARHAGCDLTITELTSTSLQVSSSHV